MKPNETNAAESTLNATQTTIAPSTSQTGAEKLRALQRAAILKQVNEPAYNHFGERVEVTSVLTETERRDIGNGMSAFKTSWYAKTPDGKVQWIDTYTDQCHEQAKLIQDMLGGTDFPETPVAGVFDGVISKRNKGKSDANPSARFVILSD